MTRIADHIDEELLIVQRRVFGPRYELRSGDSVIGRLAFRSIVSSTADAQSADGSWSFHRIGFLSRQISIRQGDQEIARFTGSLWTSGGNLSLLRGPVIRLRGNFWMTTFQLATDDGTPLVRYAQIRWFLRRSATIRILPAAASLPELPWLPFLGWLVIVLATRRRRASPGGGA